MTERPDPIEPQPPIVEIERPPVIRRTISGQTDEEGAAAWLTYITRNSVKPRTLRDWRRRQVGPPYRRTPHGRGVWYVIADLETWAETCAVDPLAA